MSKPQKDQQPPAYDQSSGPAQPSQAHLDPRSQQNNTFSPSPGPNQPYYQQEVYGPQGPGYASPAPQGGYYGSGGDRGLFSHQQQGMYYGPPQPQGWGGPGYQQGYGGYPPQGPYGPQYGYAGQNSYYDRRNDRDTGCCAIFAGTLAACCCLDLFLF